jgi:hypothetical protein
MPTCQINVDTGSVVNTVIKNAGNPFDATYILNNTYKGFRKATLKNAQIPLGFYNVRSPYNTFTIYNNYTTYSISPTSFASISSFVSTVTSTLSAYTGSLFISNSSLSITNYNVPQLPSGFYTLASLSSTLTTLLTPYIGLNSFTLNSFTIYASNYTTYTIVPGNYNITTLLNTLNTTVTASIGLFTVSPLTNIMQFASASGQVTVSGTLLSLFGFVSSVTPSSMVYATYSYIINFDTYIYIFFPQFGNASGENILGTFKIPVNAPPGSILQWLDYTQNTQSVVITDRSSFFDRITFQVRDRYGNVINNNGLDWSFTLEIELDG